MGVWLYLEEFFTDVPTFGVLARRLTSLVLTMFICIIALTALNANKAFGVIIYFAWFFAIGRLMRRYQQRQ